MLMKKNRNNAKKDFINFFQEIKNLVHVKKLLPKKDFQENLEAATKYPI